MKLVDGYQPDWSRLTYIYQRLANIPFPELPKKSKNHKFSNGFWGYGNVTLAGNGLK